jgi:hypothetical protein
VTVPRAALAAITVSGSPYGSTSLARTAIVTGVSSAVVAVSLPATGAGLVIVHVKLVAAVAPLESVAVMVTA